MIVILHGIPGDASKLIEHKINAFEETIAVRLYANMGMDAARAIVGQDSSMKDRMSLAHSTTEHNLIFNFKYHDGEKYHYEFTGEVE